jgi:hypothetical protein
MSDSSIAFASDTSCFQLGSFLGPLSKIIGSTIKKECFSKSLTYLDGKKVESQDEKLKISGFENMIFIQEGVNKTLLVGDKTKLYRVLDLKLTPDEKSLIVLNSNSKKEKSLLTFDLSRIGNISPKFINSNIDKLTDKIIGFSDDSKNIIIRSENKAQLYVIDKDSRSPIANRRPAAVDYKRLSLNSEVLASALSVIDISDSAIVLDKSGKIRNVSVEKGHFSENWSIPHAEISSKSLVKIYLDKKSKDLVVLTDDGEKIRFQLAQ